MWVGFRDVGDEVGCVFDAIVAIGCEAHEVGAAAFAFDHVADGFFVEGGLGEDADDEGAVFDEGDGAMFEFAGGVGF